MTSFRKVRFSETSQLVFVSNISEGLDKHNIWFTQDELDDFKANFTSDILLVRHYISRRHRPSVDVLLGLEKFLTIHLTEEYMKRRCRRTKEVLNEDRLQRNSRLPLIDVDRLARISAESSKWSRERARASALFLEQDQETGRQQDL